VSRRDRIALLVVLGAAVLAGFWFLALSPKRHEASNIGKKVDEKRTELDALRQDVAASEAARAAYAANYTAVARLGKAVPADDDVPSLVYQLDRTATNNDVDFRTLKLTSSSGNAPPPPPAASGGSGGQSGSNGQSGSGDQAQNGGSQNGGSGNNGGGGESGSQSGQSGGATSTAAAPSQAATADLPPGAVVGTAGIATMPFSFKFEGSFFNLAGFFGRVERYVRGGARLDVTGRLLTIDGISLTEGPGGFPKMNASVSATAYVLPGDEGLTGGASPVGPSPVQPAAAASGGAAPAPAPAAVTGVGQ
jgi:hypothetical protein